MVASPTSPRYSPIGEPDPLTTENEDRLPAENAHLESTPTTASPNPRPLRYLWWLVKATGAWTAAGILFMLVGITASHLFILHQVYVCPGGATCPNSFDPGSDVFQWLRTVMQYWLQLGTVIAGFGLNKLPGYQSWLTMKHRGNTISVLDLNVGALKGNMFDAGLLVLKRRNRSLGIFTLLFIVITNAIGFIVGRSISTVRQKGQHVKLSFDYPENVTLPYSAIYSGDISTSHTIIAWLDDSVMRKTNVLPGDDFQGTAVVRDNRTLYAINPQPSGMRVTGYVSCEGPGPNLSVSAITRPGGYPGYSIIHDSQNLTIYADEPLLVSFVGHHRDISNGISELGAQFLWISNSTEGVPNATAVADGKLFMAMCNHTISASKIPPAHGKDVQYINPSRMIDTGLDDDICGRFGEEICLVISVQMILEEWWKVGRFALSSESASSIFCSSGVLNPFVNYGGPACRVDDKMWAATLTFVLDTIVETAGKSGNATQELWARTESISLRWWWLQAVIPLSTLLLYVACLGYTLYVNSKREELQELNLLEVMTAYTSELPGIAGERVLTGLVTVGGAGTEGPMTPEAKGDDDEEYSLYTPLSDS